MSSAFERLQKLAQAKKDQEKPKLEIVGKDNQPTQPIIPNQDNQPNVPNTDNQLNQGNVPNQPKKRTQTSSGKVNKPIAPEKDFTKVPNSVTRNAIPERLFKGMSKNTYDALYLKTRGAISPVRRIRATKSDLIRWTGVSDVTLDKHLKHLRSVGLVNWEFIIGSHDGNWYEVFIPEEIDLTNVTNLTYPMEPNLPNEVGGQVPNLVGGVGGGQVYQEKEFSPDSKTLYKTNTIDDDKQLAFLRFIERFAVVSKKLTGKGISSREADKWEALADLLILELEVAANRAGGVSSVPAFLTEVLRRQFFTARQQQKGAAKSSKTKPDTVGKSDLEQFEIKPLDEQGREAALEELREFANEDFLEDFKKWYTEEDWQWLEEKLKA